MLAVFCNFKQRGPEHRNRGLFSLEIVEVKWLHSRVSAFVTFIGNCRIVLHLTSPPTVYEPLFLQTTAKRLDFAVFSSLWVKMVSHCCFHFPFLRLLMLLNFFFPCIYWLYEFSVTYLCLTLVHILLDCCLFLIGLWLFFLYSEY